MMNQGKQEPRKQTEYKSRRREKVQSLDSIHFETQRASRWKKDEGEELWGRQEERGSKDREPWRFSLELEHIAFS